LGVKVNPDYIKILEK